MECQGRLKVVILLCIETACVVVAILVICYIHTYYAGTRQLLIATEVLLFSKSLYPSSIIIHAFMSKIEALLMPNIACVTGKDRGSPEDLNKQKSAIEKE